MRFEVEVDDGANLAALHKAREQYNADNAKTAGFIPAADAPSYVQRLMDTALANALAPLGPVTLEAALGKLSELTVANAALEQQIADTAAPAPVIAPATPA